MTRRATIALAMMWYVASSAWAAPMPTAFTYQGQLKFQGTPLNGTADFTFRLWSAPTGGTAEGMIGPMPIDVTDGLLAVDLDFGDAVFRGSAHWLEIRVAFPSGSGEWTTLSPRRPITPAPYALFSARAGDLDLPYAATVNSGETTFALTQSGGGHAAAFSVNNPSNDQAALYASQSGTGPAGEFFVSNASNDDAAVFASSLGGGAGVFGQNLSSGPAVKGTAFGTGRAASFHTEIVNNDSPTVYAEQKGAGRCAHFRITNAANDLASVAASTTGGGAAVSGFTVGAGPAVHAQTDGSGYALHADSTNDAALSGGGAVLVGRETGINVAIDGNEIMARNNGETSTLFINNDGGDVVFGGAVDIGYEIVSERIDDEDSVYVYCPAGKKVLGGGCAGATPGDYVEESRPWGSTAWYCKKRYALSTLWVTGWAICANVK